MGAVRALWRLALAGLHLVHGMAQVALVWPWVGEAGRQARVRAWAAGLLARLGVGLEVHGVFRPGATLLVANHVSWLDILAIHAASPRARFVSKAEVRHWPLLGWLIGAVGTLFIERARKRDALRVVHQVAEALGQGDAVVVFPEGTTGDGRSLLPFHANLLQAAIATATPVQPVAIAYREPGHPVSPSVSWVGAATLAHSAWAVARARGVVVRVLVQPAVQSAHADRRVLAEHLREWIGRALDEHRQELAAQAQDGPRR